mmetsp:Transcript_34515/g.75535  ORF Transcript_34515/g.75535 Transcript_34515/m.75535 type:complete len:730 (+) Transcript_34515:21-2210(+)
MRSPVLRRRPQAWLSLLVGGGILPTAAGQYRGDPGCPCVDWASALDEHLDLETGLAAYRDTGLNQTYFYPASYGSFSCAPHDEGLPPWCEIIVGLPAPSWCAKSWCFINPTQCDKVFEQSYYWPGANLHFSYHTCGDQNTFSSWFCDGIASEASTKTTSLVTVADVVEQYVYATRNRLEAMEAELETRSGCSTVPLCGCRQCVCHAPFKELMDFSAAAFWVHPSQTVTSKQQCFSHELANTFTRVAGAEYTDRTRVAQQYFAEQVAGAFTMWPAMDWCPARDNPLFDFRLRPWYAAGSSGPKHVVIVVDISGAIAADKAQAIRDGTVAAIKTLHWQDSACLVLYDGTFRLSSPIRGGPSILSYADAVAAVESDGGRFQKMNDTVRDNLVEWAQQAFDTGGDGSSTLQAALNVAIRALESASAESPSCNKVILLLNSGAVAETDPSGPVDFSSLVEILSNTSTVVFSYLLGDTADATVSSQLACGTGGVLYRIPDGEQQQKTLLNAIAGYLTYFSTAENRCQIQWVDYADAATGTRLVAACVPLYNHSQTWLGPKTLVGVVCTDMNIIVPIDELKSYPGYDELNERISREAQRCGPKWVNETGEPISQEERERALQQLRLKSADLGTGAQQCPGLNVGRDDFCGYSMPPCERRLQGDSTAPRRMTMRPSRKLQDVCDSGGEQSYAEEWIDENGEVQTCTPTYGSATGNCGTNSVVVSFYVVFHVVLLSKG